MAKVSTPHHHKVALGDEVVLSVGEVQVVVVKVGTIIDNDGYLLVGITGPSDSGSWDDPEAPYSEIYCRVQ